MVDIFDDVLRKRRRQNAAVSERPMTELGATLAPSNDLVAQEEPQGFLAELLIAGKVPIDDFAVVEHSLNLFGSEVRTESQGSKRRAAGMSGESLTLQETGTNRGTGIPGNRLYID